MAIKNLRGLSDLAKAATGTKGKQVLAVPLEYVVSKKQIRKRFPEPGGARSNAEERRAAKPDYRVPEGCQR